MTRAAPKLIAYTVRTDIAYAMTDDPSCICARLRRASRALTRHYDGALAQTGLTVTQFSILRTVSRLGDPTLAELAEQTAHEKSALWRTLQPLIRNAWISVTPGRTQRFGLTPLGQAQISAAYPLWREAQAGVSERLGADQAVLMNLLSQVEAHV